MQPTYLPWLGFFDLIRKSDVFVFLDHVQFSKQSWQQRNRIRNKNGELLLTIPVKKPLENNFSIKKILIDKKQKPYIKHLKSIRACYGKSPKFDKIYQELESIYNKKFDYLIDLNKEIIRFGCESLEIEANFLFSSKMQVQGEKIETLIEICKKTNSNKYLSTLGSQEYLTNTMIFSDNNIDLSYHNFKHPIYKQMNYNNFISHLSFIDYLFNRL